MERTRKEQGTDMQRTWSGHEESMERTWSGHGEHMERTWRGRRGVDAKRQERMRTKFAERESERLDDATEMKTQTGTTRGFSWHVGTAKKHRARCLWVTTVAKGPLPRFTVTRVGSSWNPSLCFDAHPHLVHPDLHDALAAEMGRTRKEMGRDGHGKGRTRQGMAQHDVT